LARSRIFVDSRDAIMAECGDVLLALAEKSITADQVQTEIGDVLAGTKPGRTGTDEVTLYKSVGIAIQDVATAQLVYHKALQRGVGTDVIV
jgi:alanine dehydrogenase